MKLHDNSPEHPVAALDTTMASIEALSLSADVVSDRLNGDLPAAVHSGDSIEDQEMENLEHPSDPDAQATVTDFLDFTEYLPSDMLRSLTLVGNLDRIYLEASRNAHEFTKSYGELPLIQDGKRPRPIQMRADASQNINEAVNCRILSHAEAYRMAENVDRHCNRAKTILAKLQAMAETYPVSRDASPVPQTAPSSPQTVRPSKITLRLDGARPSGTANTGPRVPRHRAPRITVPGDVLAPYEFDYDSYGSESDGWDSADDDLLTPRQTPARAMGTTMGRIKLINRPKSVSRIKGPKPPRAPRPPGSMGTNVHSAVAGISTSNALRECTPPPPDVVPGDRKHAPWLELTKYELAKLRKRMKKNAVWSPSDTMILRELKLLGRGIEGYRAAKAKAEAAGEPFEYEIPAPVYDASGKKVIAEGAISIDAVSRADLNQENRGMKLNQAKKLKRETQAKELAKLAAEEAEESARKMAEAASAIKGLFAKPPSKSTGGGISKAAETPTKTPARAAPKKRKRESTADTDGTKADGDTSKSIIIPKRSKTETPVPAPIATTSGPSSNALIMSVPPTPDEVPTEPVLAPISTANTNLTLLPASPKKPTTPILPPTKDSKKDIKKPTVAPPVTRRRTSAAATPTPAPEQAPLPLRRPVSRASSRPASRGKAASVEPAPATAAKDRSRRASTVHNTPAPEVHQVRPSSRRAKRPAPGPVTAGATGSTAVSVGKRSAAPRKKAGSKKQQKDEGKDSAEIWDEVDDEGNIIDPNEARYCLCNRVSFGVMICCENTDVSSDNSSTPNIVLIMI